MEHLSVWYSQNWTEDRRKELAKDVKKKAGSESCCTYVRRDGKCCFKKLKGTEISEDEIKDLKRTSEDHRQVCC